MDAKILQTNRKLQITAGVLEIISGASWLLNVLLVNAIANLFGSAVNLLELLLPISIILCGTGLCAGHYIFSNRKIEKSVLVVDGLLDLGLIGAQFWIQYNSKSQETFVIGLGVFPIILLLIAAFFIFFSIGGFKNTVASLSEIKEQNNDTNNPVATNQQLKSSVIVNPKLNKPDWHEELNRKVQAYQNTRNDVFIKADEINQPILQNQTVNSKVKQSDNKKIILARLAALETLRKTNVLSEQEYNFKKTQLINNLSE